MISNFQHFDVHIFLSVWYWDLFLPLIINSSPFPPSLSRTNCPWVCRRLPRYRSEDLNISGLHFMGYDTFRSLPVGVVSVVPSEWSYPRASEPKPSRPPTCHASLLLPLPISLVIPEYTAFGFLSFLAHTLISFSVVKYLKKIYAFTPPVTSINHLVIGQGCDRSRLRGKYCARNMDEAGGRLGVLAVITHARRTCRWHVQTVLNYHSSTHLHAHPSSTLQPRTKGEWQTLNLFRSRCLNYRLNHSDKACYAPR